VAELGFVDVQPSSESPMIEPMMNTKRITEIAEKLNLVRSESARRREIFEETRDVMQDALGRPISNFAKQVLLAGQRRRGELPPDTQKLSPTARGIINAGRKARNEDPI
jgi:hypothetical protein